MKAGEVGLLHCPVCGESTSIVIASRNKAGIELSGSMVGPELCEKCREIQKQNVTFHCASCKGFQTVKFDSAINMGLKVELGDHFKIHKGTCCSESNRLVLWPPEQEAQIKRELEQKAKLVKKKKRKQTPKMRL